MPKCSYIIGTDNLCATYVDITFGKMVMSCADVGCARQGGTCKENIRPTREGAAFECSCQ